MPRTEQRNNVHEGKDDLEEGKQEEIKMKVIESI